ncbi:MAG: endo-1,4-beta-xylanase [Propionibacteriaceae bacterium]|nr:endo-1,4-beta-xylanase [Propionibacteriaceae bacterium]
MVRRPERFRHRTARTLLTVRDAAGLPLRDTPIHIEQRRHAFAFGNIGFDLIPLANGDPEVTRGVYGGASARLEVLADLFLEVFNTATLPFYWRGFEPERGRPDTARLSRAARWFADRDVAVKGHPLVWHTLAPTWLGSATADEVMAAVRSRITREVADFAGLIDTWDAINEVVILPEFTAEENPITRLAQREGRVGMVRLAFETARAANPRATLLLNDFNLSVRYERLVADCLAAGIRIDALGLQSHMHQGYWGEERTAAVLDRFARFGLPLHWTETTLLSGDLMPPEIVDLNDYQVASWPSTPAGEERQAEELVRHYTTLFAHPSVQAVTYWGLTDDGAWLGAPAGLVRADGTQKPAYDELRRLVKGEWWLPRTGGRTDALGRVVLDAYLGDYAVTAGGAEALLTLAAGGSESTVTLSG